MSDPMDPTKPVGIFIEKVQNGFVVTLPRDIGFMTEMIEQMMSGFQEADGDPVLIEAKKSALSEINRFPAEKFTHIFKTFKEVLAFLDGWEVDEL